MAFAVLLDTCVLYPSHLRDTLLRLAERDLYLPLWSSDILNELGRNLIDEVMTGERFDHLITEMRNAFEDAEVQGYKSLIPSMECDEKDRHVLAAAVRSRASVILTFNVNDFPDHSTNMYGIDIISPDMFLLDLLDLFPSIVVEVLDQQARTNRQPPRTRAEIVTALEIAGVSKFADEIRRGHLL